jgi:site-specific recombinase XerD
MLTLYRRHTADCAHRAKGRNWRKCACPIWVQGSLSSEYIRKSLDLSSWTAASELVHGWESAGEIGGRRSEAPSTRDAIAKYIAASHVKPQTLLKTKDALERLFLGFCQARGLRRLRQIDLTILLEYKNTLTKYAITTQRAKLEQVRAFFRFCVNAGWLTANPAVALELPRAERDELQTFSGEEIDRMLGAASKLAVTGRYRDGNRKRARAMIYVLRFSGMRISDASTLAKKSLTAGALHFKTRKTGSIVWCPLPTDAVAALRESVSDNSDYFFWNGRHNPQSAVKIWERTFRRIFQLAAIPREKRFVHNFRHTLATDLLTKGASLEDVAMILGNSVKIVEKHYAHLVLARRKAIEQRVRMLWAS